MINTYCSILGKKIPETTMKYFFLSYFPRKQVLTFQMDGENLHNLSNPVFWKKWEKYFKLSSKIFTQHAKD